MIRNFTGSLEVCSRTPLPCSLSSRGEGDQQTVSSTAAARSSRLAGSSHCKQLRLIATKEFGDRFRSGWVIACMLVWLGAIGLTSFYGLLQIGRVGAQGYERTVIGLLNLVQYLVPLLGLLLGHDLIVSENEDRTLRLILAGSVSRTQLVIGKFFGGCFALAVPLLFGFMIAGTLIGLAAKDNGIAPFLGLAGSGVMLGIIFLGIGLSISTFCRTRVQALVLALLTWCLAVFVFDLIALSAMLSTKSSAAVQEIEMVCDTTHVNQAADIHSDFNNAASGPSSAVSGRLPDTFAWLAINPVDLFRALNLSKQTGFTVPVATTLLSVFLWLTLALGTSVWKLRRTDL